MEWANNHALDLANAQCAWTITMGTPSLRIAVVDTDFDEIHEDLIGQIREVYGPVTKGHGHGTEVLGVAGAKPNNIGIIGAGYNLRWDGSRVSHEISSNGGAHSINDGVANAITAAVNKGARVINVSWTGIGSYIIPDPETQSFDIRPVMDLVDQGIILIVAAGNNVASLSHSLYADIPGVINVSGVDYMGYAGNVNKAKNQWVDLCAYSENVTCTKINNQYGGANGTSSAAPQVAATAGLILSLNECYTPAQVEYIIKSTTSPIPDAHLFPGVVGTGYLNMYEAVKFAAGRNETLLGDETWTSTQIISGNLIIPSNVTLTIKSDVWLYKDAKIHVEQGGKLIVDGGHLTSICEDWGGIFVEGNASLSQMPLSNQGLVEIKNSAVIENGHEGVFLAGIKSSGEVDWNKTGGIVIASNSTFKNNRRDVCFLNFENKNANGIHVNNYSNFTNCQFITTSDVATTKLDPHITMWQVNGVRILGCTFEDQRTNINAKEDGRTGIKTIDANYVISDYCTNNMVVPCQGIPCNFNNMQNAIESISNGTMGKITIENSEFNSYKGVFLQGINNARIVNNIFNIEHDILVPLNTDYPYGLYLDQCQMFNVEGNIFNGTTGGTNPVIGGAAGLVIRNTGANNNEFYRNKFHNIKMASQALSENREEKIDFGLRFACNEYTQTLNDLDIRNDLLNPYKTYGKLGIAGLQGISVNGSIKLPANKFANQGFFLNYNIGNNGNWVNYLYTGADDKANLYRPWSVTSNVLIIKNPSAVASCPNRIDIWGAYRHELKEDITLIKPLMIVKQNDWDGVTDGGNTESLVNDILTVTNGTILALYTQLMNLSPYLSNEVLALIAEQDAPFTPIMIRDILVSNPHSGRSTRVQTNLDNRVIPIPNELRIEINEAGAFFTARDELSEKLASLYYEYDMKLAEIIYSYLSDSLISIDSVSKWLKHPLNATYHYQLAEWYFDKGDYTSFNKVVDSIPLLFTLNANQQAYHNNFISLYGQLKYWKDEEISLMDLTSSEINGLISMTETGDYYPVAILGILALHDIYANQPTVYIDTDEPLYDVPAFAEHSYISGVVYDANTLLPLGNVNITFTNHEDSFVSVSLIDGSYNSTIKTDKVTSINLEVDHTGYLQYVENKNLISEQDYIIDIYLVPIEDNESILDKEKLHTIIEDINSETHELAILLYPNPATDEITLQWKKGFQASDVKVYDINGRLFAQKSWEMEGSLTLHTGTWAEGTYFVFIETSEQKKMYMKLTITK